MKLKELKSGLFGYQKSSVYQYITDLEEQFSQKLQEKEQEIQTLTQRYQQQIADLEEQVHSLEEQTMRQNQELERCDYRRQRLREQLRSILLEMNVPADQSESSIEEGSETVQTRNMSLFQRKTVPETDQEGDKGGR